MYNNNNSAQSHYTNTGYQPGYSQYPPQTYSGNYGNYPGYTGYSNQSTQQQPGTGQEPYPSNNWATTYRSNPDPKDAVAQEMQQQKAQLIQQREDYVKKASVLRYELDQLKMQKQDLVGNGQSPDMDLTNILKQNDKLQDEIQGKLKAIHNVIEMLSSIIKDNKSISDLEAELLTPEIPNPATTPISHHQQPHFENNPYKNPPPMEPVKNSPEAYCYVHYDTGLHWCRMCDEFPDTAKDFLLHLQDKKHRETAKENDLDATPWHKLPTEPLMPSDEDAPKKRVPIKGLQFFISAPSWYCKLCDVWIGDLHCASQHLKSKTHHQNYENFVSQNPHWEMEWLKDRETSMTRKGPPDSSESDDAKKKRKRKEKQRLSADMFSLKEKKKKKKSRRKRKQSSDSSSSSSSSSDSSDDENEDRSRSIRVAMRNMKQVQSIMDEDLTAKWNVLEKLVEEHKKKELKDKHDKEKKEENDSKDDPLINQWMTISQPPPKEKMMLESLKDRMRQKEIERTRINEQEKHRREREREDAERLERKKREEKEMAEEEERKRNLREQEEMDRMKDKERGQVRFRANTYRKRRSYSRSDEEDNKNEERYYNKRDSYRRESERDGSHRNRHSRSRSRSPPRSADRKHERQENEKKKPPGPPSYKKLPFIGRMPLFKNKAKHQDEKDDVKELKKQSYDQPRRTRFEPGNLPKAFMPKPDVVCFPKLSSIPPLIIPPPAPVVIERVPIPPIPEAPKISKIEDKHLPKAPPPPKFDKKEEPQNLSDDEVLYGSQGANASMMGQYYQNYGNSYINNNYNNYQEEKMISPPPPPPHSHSMPLQPPPLPPDDDLALLGICADDMAAQSF